jgi:glutathione S-transferase
MPLTESADLVLFHATRSRSFRVLWFLEELGEPYRIEPIDLDKNEQKSDRLIRHNPMGKVPVVLDGDVAISESGAIYIYLSDKYAPGRLAPRPGEERERAEYLRWMFFAAGVMEPAFGEKFFKWELNPRQVAWGSFQSMLETLEAGIRGKEWLLGDKFTAADVFVGSNVHFGTLFGILPKEGPIAAYLARCAARPALKRALQLEEGWIAEKEKAKAATA